MWNWFKRLWKIGKSEANALLDQTEDPTKIGEQTIRELKNDLSLALQGLAEVKSLAIRQKRELDLATKTARDYENKAILLLQKAQQGEISSDEADYLAAQALAKKEQIESKIPAMQKSMEQYHHMVEKLEKNISELKSKILDWENELRTLKARDTVSKVTAKINRQLSMHDASSTHSHLAQLKSKVEQQEALAESFNLLKDTSLDDEIEKALGKNQTTDSRNSLERLKAKLSTPHKLNRAENKPDATFSETSALEKLKRRLQNID